MPTTAAPATRASRRRQLAADDASSAPPPDCGGCLDHWTPLSARVAPAAEPAASPGPARSLRQRRPASSGPPDPDPPPQSAAPPAATMSGDTGVFDIYGFELTVGLQDKADRYACAQHALRREAKWEPYVRAQTLPERSKLKRYVRKVRRGQRLRFMFGGCRLVCGFDRWFEACHGCVRPQRQHNGLQQPHVRVCR